jgi:hypothetical protein
MITALNNIDPATPIGKLALAAISTTEFTDDQFKSMLLGYKIPEDPEDKGLEDLLKVIQTVEKNRPELYRKIEKQIRAIQSKSE